MGVVPGPTLAEPRDDWHLGASKATELAAFKKLYGSATLAHRDADQHLEEFASPDGKEQLAFCKDVLVRTIRNYRAYGLSDFVWAVKANTETLGEPRWTARSVDGLDTVSAMWATPDKEWTGWELTSRKRSPVAVRSVDMIGSDCFEPIGDAGGR